MAAEGWWWLGVCLYARVCVFVWQYGCHNSPDDAWGAVRAEWELLLQGTPSLGGSISTPAKQCRGRKAGVEGLATPHLQVACLGWVAAEPSVATYPLASAWQHWQMEA